MSDAYDKVAVSWKEEHEKEYGDMLKLALNPHDKISVANYRETNSTPTHYQVNGY